VRDFETLVIEPGHHRVASERESRETPTIVVHGDVACIATAPGDEAVVVLGSRHPSLEVGIDVYSRADHLIDLAK
jgi:hypothetical protein